MGPESVTCCMESMWRDLPVSVVEKVFTFLPIASLCRFRTLSKEWSSFISSLTFKHIGEYTLITPRWGRPGGGWVVLDVARKRYFTLSDAFLTEHVHRKGLVKASSMYTPRALQRMYLAAADGGLFCVRYFFSWLTSGLFVCNPILKTVKQLPPSAGVAWGEFVQTVVMATNKSSMEYEIFIVNYTMHHTEGEAFEPESILVYKSKTGSWRRSPYQPFSYQICWGSLTVFNNNLYCIVNKGDCCGGLVSYDKETGVVCDLKGIHFPYAPRSHLVVSNARLLCVIPLDNRRDDFPSVRVVEIDVVERTSTLLTEMPRALLIWVIGDDLKRGFDEMDIKIQVATASMDYILIASIVGRCAAYSLPHNLWHQFPDDRTLLEEFCRGKAPREEIYGSNNCLSHCAS